MLNHLFAVAGVTLAAMLLGAAILHTIPLLGRAGRRIGDAMCRAPGLDVSITYFTIAPLIVGPIVAGWIGFLGALVGQVASVFLWQWTHEALHPEGRHGPRIVKVMNAKVGRWRNHTAAWVTAICTPLFWFIRLAEIFVYAPLPRLVGLPKYKHSEWVNVSRQKFQGLIGHDLIWCLYCDWMTGVWSLGSEMLRNVESFWCPIRFRSDRKCVNCATDFPDIENGWIPADGTMAEVAETIERMYPNDLPRAWFGHPVRITVKGQSIEREPVMAK
jgi:hypothetical protein